ncbi:uncharacterized protein LOC120883753 [Ictidomys tridecemlineatus]
MGVGGSGHLRQASETLPHPHRAQELQDLAASRLLRVCSRVWRARRESEEERPQFLPAASISLPLPPETSSLQLPPGLKGNQLPARNRRAAGPARPPDLRAGWAHYCAAQVVALRPARWGGPCGGKRRRPRPLRGLAGPRASPWKRAPRPAPRTSPPDPARWAGRGGPACQSFCPRLANQKTPLPTALCPRASTGVPWESRPSGGSGRLLRTFGDPGLCPKALRGEEAERDGPQVRPGRGWSGALAPEATVPATALGPVPARLSTVSTGDGAGHRILRPRAGPSSTSLHPCPLKSVVSTSPQPRPPPPPPPPRAGRGQGAGRWTLKTSRAVASQRPEERAPARQSLCGGVIQQTSASEGQLAPDGDSEGCSWEGPERQRAPPPGLATLSSSPALWEGTVALPQEEDLVKTRFSQGFANWEHCVVTCVQSLRAETHMCKAQGHSHAPEAEGRGPAPSACG